MTQLNSVVQRNASAAEEMAAASHDLGEEANKLRTAVSTFKI